MDQGTTDKMGNESQHAISTDVKFLFKKHTHLQLHPVVSFYFFYVF